MNKSQRGFTTVELIIGLVTAGIIAGSTATTVFQVVTGSARTNNHMLAVKQVQNAGYWVSYYAQMAQSVELGVPTGSLFTLTWTSQHSGDGHQVTYTVEDMAGGSHQLTQSHTVNPGLNQTVTETIAAQYIVPGAPDTYVEFTNGVLTFTVTVSVGTGSQQQTETRVYTIIPRPS